MAQMIGHTKYDANGNWTEIESLEDHSRKASQLSERFLAPAGLGLLGRLVAISHDMGKASDIFAKRVGVLGDGDGSSIRYNHMMYGANHMLSLYGHTKLGKMLAMAIACHHGGLRNWSVKPSEETDNDRIYRDDTFMSMKEKYKEDCEKNPDYAVYPEVVPMVESLSEGCMELDTDRFGLNGNGKSYYSGYWGLLTRLLFSGLVDADCLATEAYYDHTAPKRRENHHDDLYTLRTKLYKYIGKFCNDDTDINKWRTNILKSSQKAAVRNKGIFTMEADVGGGKSLAMLGFAISHAINHGMKRIIYLAPYGAVIEQTANNLKKIFGKNNVCVHHINMDTTKMSRDALLACDNWDSPIIASSVEQFFDSLYSNKNSRCRKLHNLVDSVVLIDEFHDLPLTKMWQVTHAIDGIVQVFRSSVVLASATLPVMDALKQTLSDGSVSKLFAHIPKDIVPAEYFSAPRKRVKKLFDANLSDWDSLAKAVSTQKQCMVVVNTRVSAYQLASCMKKHGMKNVYHLSASLTPYHRERMLAEVIKRLDKKLPVILVCTSIVQTGVDISFPVIYREMCGCTAYDQTCGRCNRNGENEIGFCILFPQIGDNIPGLPQLQTMAFQSLLRKAGYDPEKVSKEEYWREYVRLYVQKNPKTAYDNNKVSLYELKEDDLSFETIAAKAKIIDDGQQNMMVLCDESRAVIEKIEHYASLTDEELRALPMDERRRITPTKEDKRIAQRFTVMAYGNDYKDECDKKHILFPWLVEIGLAHKVVGMDNMYILDKGYDAEYGISVLIDQFNTAKRQR